MECDRCSAEILNENESNPMLNFEFEAVTNESQILKTKCNTIFWPNMFTHTKYMYQIDTIDIVDNNLLL